jgi:uncharacterized protein
MQEKNVLDEPLRRCSREPLTGYRRDGFCRPVSGDSGNHLVCARVSEEFLDFTRSRGNDLSSLKPGDRWCLCAGRWKEAYDEGVVAQVVPEATSKQALRFLSAEDLLLAADGLYGAHRASRS